jgi:hypothetical protein
MGDKERNNAGDLYKFETLLKKVGELTLYGIEPNKKIEQLL